MANLFKPIHDLTYSTFICPFESGKCGKEGKKIQKCEYLENEKSLLDEIKAFFIVLGYRLVKPLRTPIWKNIDEQPFMAGMNSDW